MTTHFPVEIYLVNKAYSWIRCKLTYMLHICVGRTLDSTDMVEYVHTNTYVHIQDEIIMKIKYPYSFSAFYPWTSKTDIVSQSHHSHINISKYYKHIPTKKIDKLTFPISTTGHVHCKSPVGSLWDRSSLCISSQWCSKTQQCSIKAEATNF